MGGRRNYGGSIQLPLTPEEAMLQRSIVVSHAQILLLDTNPVELVPAPPPGFGIMPFGVMYCSHIPAVGYGNFDPVDCFLEGTHSDPSQQSELTAPENRAAAPVLTDLTVLLTPPGAWYPLLAGGLVPAGLGYVTVINNGLALAAVDAQPYILTLINPAGHLTGGAPANFINVTTFYAIAPVN